MIDTIRKVALVCDHTELNLAATSQQISDVCTFAREYQTASVCVRLDYVAQAKRELQHSGVAVCTVIGFPDGKWPGYMPQGYPSTEQKVAETRYALSQGATEIDVVVHIPSLLTGQIDQFRRDIGLVVKATRAAGGISKVIVENCFVPDDLKPEVYGWVMEEGADFLKTSTGMGRYGSQSEDLRLMRAAAGNKGVKAAGGVNEKNYLEHIRAALGAAPETPLEELDLNPSKVRIGESSLLAKLLQPKS